jgi:CRP-like cAMP-binding protein
MTLVAASKKLTKFDTKTFLATINGGRKIEDFPRRKTIFAQGDSSDAVFYIKKGKVRLAVVSEIGKEATIGILKEGDFFGDRLLRDENPEEVHDGRASSGTRIFRHVRGLFVGTEHSIRSGFG